MVEKDGLKLHMGNPELTFSEKEILHLITDEFLTIKQISQRRHCSLQAIYKIIKKIKNKGFLDIGLNKVEKIEPTFNQSDLRLHGQELNIRILWQDNKYQEQLNKSNILFLDSNSIRLYKNSIEIYSGQSFMGKEINEVERKSLDYWLHFLTRLEHELNVILIKQRARNIKIVNQHWARGKSEISENANEYRERVWVYAEEDGKLCFITDDSFGFKEDETVHPITAKPDRKAIDKQINDWRLKNPPVQSVIAQNQAEIGQDLIVLVDVVSQLIKNQQNDSRNISYIAQNYASHVKIVEKLNNLLDEPKVKRHIKNKIKGQRTLNEW